MVTFVNKKNNQKKKPVKSASHLLQLGANAVAYSRYLECIQGHCDGHVSKQREVRYFVTYPLLDKDSPTRADLHCNAVAGQTTNVLVNSAFFNYCSLSNDCIGRWSYGVKMLN